LYYVRLARGGIVEVNDAENADIEGEFLVLRAADGHPVCRFLRLDVLAYSTRRDLLINPSDGDELPS
jgi:hypothetical protein